MKLKSNRNNHDSHCFACGYENVNGLKLKFTTSKNSAIATYSPSDKHQSHRETFHGGMQAVIMDASMIQAIKSSGYLSVTGRLELRYKKNTNTKDSLTVYGEILKRQGQFIFAKSDLFQNDIKVTTATGTYKITEKIITTEEI